MKDAYISTRQIDERIAKIQDEQKRLAIELEMLRRLRSQAAPMQSDGGLASGIEERIPQRLGPKDAVLALLRSSSNLRTREIVDQLENQVASSAKNIRRCLASTIHNLTRAGDLVMDGEGRLSLENGRQ